MQSKIRLVDFEYTREYKDCYQVGVSVIMRETKENLGKVEVFADKMTLKILTAKVYHNGELQDIENTPFQYLTNMIQQFVEGHLVWLLFKDPDIDSTDTKNITYFE